MKFYTNVLDDGCPFKPVSYKLNKLMRNLTYFK